MKYYSLFLVVSIAFVAAGCGDSNDAPVHIEAKTHAKDNGASGNSGAVAGKAPAAILPANCVHAAYAYTGLGNNLRIDYVMTTNPGANLSTGAAQVLPPFMKKGVVRFKILRAGSVGEQLGANEIDECDATGVYIAECALGKLKDRILEMPANVAPGVAWKTKAEFAPASGGTITEDFDCKAIDIEKVTLKTGEYDALLVTSTGTVTKDGVATPTTSKSWYVKNVGLVKTEIQSGGASSKDTVSFEAASKF